MQSHNNIALSVDTLAQLTKISDAIDPTVVNHAEAERLSKCRWLPPLAPEAEVLLQLDSILRQVGTAKGHGMVNRKGIITLFQSDPDPRAEVEKLARANNSTDEQKEIQRRTRGKFPVSEISDSHVIRKRLKHNPTSRYIDELQKQAFLASQKEWMNQEKLRKKALFDENGGYNWSLAATIVRDKRFADHARDLLERGKRLNMPDIRMGTASRFNASSEGNRRASRSAIENNPGSAESAADLTDRPNRSVKSSTGSKNSVVGVPAPEKVKSRGTGTSSYEATNTSALTPLHQVKELRISTGILAVDVYVKGSSFSTKHNYKADIAERPYYEPKEHTFGRPELNSDYAETFASAFAELKDLGKNVMHKKNTLFKDKAEFDIRTSRDGTQRVSESLNSNTSDNSQRGSSNDVKSTLKAKIDMLKMIFKSPVIQIRADMEEVLIREHYDLQTRLKARRQDRFDAIREEHGMDHLLHNVQKDVALIEKDRANLNKMHWKAAGFPHIWAKVRETIDPLRRPAGKATPKKAAKSKTIHGI